MNKFKFLKSENISIFLFKYRTNLSNIHYKLFPIPKINKKTSFITLISSLTPWWFIKLLIQISKYTTKNNSKIGIFKHSFLEPYFDLVLVNRNNFISSYASLALKLTSYKILTDFNLNKFYIETFKDLAYFFSNKYSNILIPHDTYPETFLLTQIFKETKLSSTVCIQHGTAARIYKSQKGFSNVIYDGMNSDIFLAWDKYSADHMKNLLNTRSNILRNKSQKIIIMNCNRNLHNEYINKEKGISKIRQNILKDNLSIYFLQAFHPESIHSKIYDEFYIKILPILKNYYSSKFKSVRFIYKARCKSDIPIKIAKNRFIKAISNKGEIYNDNFSKIIFTGETSLAFELKEAGNFVIGIAKDLKDIKTFPNYIYQRTFCMKKLQDEKNSKFELINFFPNKKEIQKEINDKVLTCFNESQSCVSSSNLTKMILNLQKN